MQLPVDNGQTQQWGEKLSTARDAAVRAESKREAGEATPEVLNDALLAFGSLLELAQEMLRAYRSEKETARLAESENAQLHEQLTAVRVTLRMLLRSLDGPAVSGVDSSRHLAIGSWESSSSGHSATRADSESSAPDEKVARGTAPEGVAGRSESAALSVAVPSRPRDADFGSAPASTEQMAVQIDLQFEGFLAAESPSRTVELLARAQFYGEEVFALLYPMDAVAPPDVPAPQSLGPTGPLGPAWLRYAGQDILASADIVERFDRQYPGRLDAYHRLSLDL